MRFLTLLLLVACNSASVKLGDDTGADNGDNGGGDSTDTSDTSDSGDSTETGDTVDTGPIRTDSFTVSPGALDFGLLFVGHTDSRTVSLENTGTSTLSLEMQVTGVYASAYGLGVDLPNPAPGEVATITVTLYPTNWGDHAATLRVGDSGGDSVELPIAALVQVDADEDGYGSVETGGDDCADLDPLVHPGAEDTWYDGVDSDCAGNDDYDQDGDGAPVDVDCDDLDPGRFPGNPEVWYDGVDADCLGDDDFDQDHDGWALGDDCDDEDATVNPAADDTWYDGIDSDCAGDDDYDQDADGFRAADYGGDDCDDLNPTAHPGAEEVWYDGVDEDCLGGNDFDQDGDGVEYPTDCNDTDPTVTGPEPEEWDGIDNDCNGLVDDFSVNDIADTVYVGDAGDDVGGNNGIALGGDVTGDGVADLVVATTGRSYYGVGWLVSGADLVDGGVLDDVAVATVTGTSDRDYDAYYLPVGTVNASMEDLDGDGQDDLLMGAGYYDYYGAWGVISGADASGSLDLRDSFVIATGDSSGDFPRQGAAGDLDGDGEAELVVTGARDNYSGSGSTTSSGVVARFSRSALDGEINYGDADSQVNGASSYDYLGYSLLVADADDDGYGDVLVGAPGRNASDSTSDSGAVYLIRGSSSSTWADDVISGAATAAFYGESRSGGFGSDAQVRPADLDGDGAKDLVFADTSYGNTWIFSDAGAWTGGHALSEATVTLSGSGNFSSAATTADFDGDGVAELLVGASGDDSAASDAGAVWFFGAPWSAEMRTTDAQHVLYGSTASDALGSGLGGGADVNGDGRDEVLLGASGQDRGGSASGAVYVVTGR